MENKDYQIVIVDDDPQVHKMLTTVLSPRHLKVESVQDSTKAMDVFKQVHPDLVILDIMMPGLSGIELCRQMREDPLYKQTLILMLSAKESQNDRLNGLQYGADDYVTKPFHVSTLVHKIEHMLQKKSQVISG